MVHQHSLYTALMRNERVFVKAADKVVFSLHLLHLHLHSLMKQEAWRRL